MEILRKENRKSTQMGPTRNNIKQKKFINQKKKFKRSSKKSKFIQRKRNLSTESTVSEKRIETTMGRSIDNVRQQYHNSHPYLVQNSSVGARQDSFSKDIPSLLSRVTQDRPQPLLSRDTIQKLRNNLRHSNQTDLEEYDEREDNLNSTRSLCESLSYNDCIREKEITKCKIDEIIMVAQALREKLEREEKLRQLSREDCAMHYENNQIYGMPRHEDNSVYNTSQSENVSIYNRTQYKDHPSHNYLNNRSYDNPSEYINDPTYAEYTGIINGPQYDNDSDYDRDSRYDIKSRYDNNDFDYNDIDIRYDINDLGSENNDRVSDSNDFGYDNSEFGYGNKNLSYSDKNPRHYYDDLDSESNGHFYSEKELRCDNSDPNGASYLNYDCEQNSNYDSRIQSPTKIPRLMDLKPKIPSLLDLKITPPDIKEVLKEQVLIATSRYDSKIPDACWNCNNPGHKYLNCKKPITKKFCFRCGRRGFDVSSCPYCKIYKSIK